MISDRVALKDLCRSTLAAHFAATTGFTTVTVHFDDPGEALTDESVVFGRITGNLDAVAFGPEGSDDVFTIKTTIVTVGHATAYAAAQRAQDILDQFVPTIFEQRFGSSLGARVFPGLLNGPDADPPYDGNPAGALVEIDVNARIAKRGA